ncbi:unnamed protein product [Brugia pahangi]|uniref:Uncharacterized protein n=1 Tax=Brugia pahangi TaxID=6280 RepID=A0A0N4TW74_BRUPA|nr:unnamed protein product [Brugia pahangi]
MDKENMYQHTSKSTCPAICLQTSRKIEVNERLVADRRIEIEQHLHDSDNDNDGDENDDMMAENCSHIRRRNSRKATTSSIISLPPSPSLSPLSRSPSSSSSSSSSSSASTSGTTKTAISYSVTTITSSSIANITSSSSTAGQLLRQQGQYPER